MFKVYLWIITLLIIMPITLVGCKQDKIGTSPTKKTVEGKGGPSDLTHVQGSLTSKDYLIAASCSWDYQNTMLSAVMETRKISDGNIMPSSRLTIRNLSTQAVIYQVDLDGSPATMSIQDLTPDGSPKLYINQNIAASSRKIFVYSITASNVHAIFEKDYSGEEPPIFLYEPSSDSVDIFLSDRGPGLEPTMLHRYRWRDGQYSLIGTIIYENLHKLINDQYANNNASTRKR